MRASLLLAVATVCLPLTALAEPYPRAVISRPLTLPEGMMDGTVRATIQEGGHVGLWGASRYGLTERIDGFVGTGVTLHPSLGWGRIIDLGAAMRLASDDALDAAAGLRVPLSLATGAKVLNVLALDALFRYRSTERLAITVGRGFVPITLDPGTLGLGLTVEVGYQASPQVWASVATDVMHLALVGKGTVSTTALDFWPVRLELSVTPDDYTDVFGGVHFLDLGEAGDTWAIVVGATYRR